MDESENDAEVDSRRQSRMAAVAGDPWLKVHAIAESIFCPRAGILAHENQRDDEDDEPPSLYTLPKYELAAIEQALADVKIRCLWKLVVCGGLALAAWLTLSDQYLWVSILLGVAAFKLGQRLSTEIGVGLELLKRRRAAIGARCPEPDRQRDEMQSVNWFGLLNRGFESIRLREPLRDPTWQIEGKPWRVLRKGSLVIPVFHSKSPVDRPREQHIAKIMAYCRLVEISFGVDCPYGIILTQDDHSGYAIPHTAKFRRGFHKHLLEFRSLARESDSIGPRLQISYSPHVCQNCPLGEPHIVSLGQRIRRLEANLPIVVLRDRRGEEYHCDCGDRFEWKPPHILNRDLKQS